MKYGVLETTHRQVEGDKRSKDHPGHGYPAHTVEDIKLHEFDDEVALEKFLQQRDKGWRGYDGLRVIRFEDIKMERKLSFKVTT